MSTLDELLWIEELLPPEIYSAPKHGGMAYFQDLKMILILVEHLDRVTELKGVKYPFDLWRGCIFPIEQKRQNAFFLKYLFLENHPANKNWLYIPLESENFEEEVKQMLREIAKKNLLLGLEVKVSGPASKKKPAVKKAPTKIKADKKKENAFLLGMANRKK